MSPLWWIPLGLGVAALGLLYGAGRLVVRQLSAVQESIVALRTLRPAVVEVLQEADRTRRAVEDRDSPT